METCGKIVECIGPSGVGKSYIMRKFRGITRNNWLFDYETKKSILYQGIYSRDLCNLNIDYRELYIRKSSIILKSELDDTRKQISFNFHRSRLIQEASLFSASEHKTNGFWFDDGNLNIFSDVFLKLINERRFDIIPLKRILLFMYSDTNTIMSRLYDRSLTTPSYNNNFIGLLGTESALKNAILDSEKKYQLYESWIKNGGVGYKIDITNQEKALTELIRIEQDILKAA
jgi:hypothetical protein